MNQATIRTRCLVSLSIRHPRLYPQSLSVHQLWMVTVRRQAHQRLINKLPTSVDSRLPCNLMGSRSALFPSRLVSRLLPQSNLMSLGRCA